MAQLKSSWPIVHQLSHQIEVGLRISKLGTGNPAGFTQFTVVLVCALVAGNGRDRDLSMNRAIVFLHLPLSAPRGGNSKKHAVHITEAGQYLGP